MAEIDGLHVFAVSIVSGPGDFRVGVAGRFSAGQRYRSVFSLPFPPSLSGLIRHFENAGGG